MNFFQIAILALIQGLAELLPVSSSAHVILAQKLMGLDPSTPEMTFFLVMLHTGTMFAVILYFWARWKPLFSEPAQRSHFLKMILIATAFTGALGLGLKFLIERVIFEKILGHAHGEIEHLFKILPLVAAALLTAGLLISWSGSRNSSTNSKKLDARGSMLIGLIQGLCLPFRGFSRSGATISTGLFLGMPRLAAEEFSFALAVVLTPPLIVLQLRRLLHAHLDTPLGTLLAPGLIGMGLSLGAGLLALKWLSHWLEQGRWKFFGYYCIALALLTLAVWSLGF